MEKIFTEKFCEDKKNNEDLYFSDATFDLLNQQIFLI